MDDGSTPIPKQGYARLDESSLNILNDIPPTNLSGEQVQKQERKRAKIVIRVLGGAAMFTMFCGLVGGAKDAYYSIQSSLTTAHRSTSVTCTYAPSWC